MSTNKWFSQWRIPPDLPNKRGQYIVIYAYQDRNIHNRNYYAHYEYSGTGSFFFDSNENIFSIVAWTEIKPFKENA